MGREEAKDLEQPAAAEEVAIYTWAAVLERPQHGPPRQRALGKANPKQGQPRTHPSGATTGDAELDQLIQDIEGAKLSELSSKRGKCGGNSAASAGLRLRQGQPPMGAIAGRTYLSRNHHYYYYYHYHYH